MSMAAILDLSGRLGNLVLIVPEPRAAVAANAEADRQNSFEPIVPNAPGNLALPLAANL